MCILLFFFETKVCFISYLRNEGVYVCFIIYLRNEGMDISQRVPAFDSASAL